ncbi:hypothetical protein NMG29_07380 [Streptomyces cocklensis]|uniref:Uncharacterized protein n=1 Tax=Actinacidiphila cocklensis TaxID=887465 RepID=A0A9W4GQW2_9ACTN|nr:hypothetical protein [Actinacidiphila cocklensis]MDD1058049.1 hypothetical protein [Actinacidiphila cocklensis]WSX79509.1 hypothetical protein OH826_40085 [Streptomyces sp. NBC_00899]CAG6393074.1 conserved exported hypothetical protein [Actinacidiphila cocklensis]
MLLHMPFVIALAAVTIFLKRTSALKPSHAFACGAFGFYLADTSLAGSIHAASANLLGMLGTLGV